MLRKVLDFAKKYEELLLYLVFGFLTTVVNYLVYLLLHNDTSMLASAANVIAWIAAVAFAFVTNKPFVFKSHDWSFKILMPELGKFVSARLGSLLVETGIIFVFVDLLYWDGIIIKLVTSVIVVVLNYLASKLLVFRNR